ncbi:MAG: PorP/SprF family type IX secretion system membrane protein [Bacteroidota bacterium]
MRLLITVLITLISTISWEQDYHFSQIDRNAILYNPAATGTFNGYEQFSTSHRNQWLGAGTQFMTSLVSAEFTIGKGIRNEKSYLGLGILLLNDIGGDSRFGNKTAALNFSGVVPVTNQSQFSAGLQTAFTNRSADLSRVTFLSQWDGYGLDPSIPSGEENGMTNFNYLDASAGINYKYDQTQKKVIRENALSFETGLAFFHLNRPKLRYNSITTDRLKIKSVFNSKINYSFSINASMEVSFLYAQQGPHRELVGGVFYKTRVVEGSKITKNKQDSYIGFGSYYQSSGVLIPAISLDYGNFKFGVSYDMLLTKLRNGYGGSLEFSCSWRSGKWSLFQR